MPNNIKCQTELKFPTTKSIFELQCAYNTQVECVVCVQSEKYNVNVNLISKIQLHAVTNHFIISCEHNCWLYLLDDQ